MQQVLMPRLSQTMETGRVVKWLKQEGDPIKKGEPIVTIETDKAVSDLEAPESGVLARIAVPEGAEVGVDVLLGTITLRGEDDSPRRGNDSDAHGTPTPPRLNAQAARTEPEADKPRKAISPAARKLAQDLGIDLALVSGTGEGGLVSARDVQAFLARPKETTQYPVDENEEVIPLTGMRGRIAESLSRSRRTAADVTTVIDVDMTDVCPSHGEREVSFTAVVIWAAARALTHFPILNAWLIDDKIHLKKQRDIGVAVALTEGLIVPVVRSADSKTAREITAEVNVLASRARAGQLTAEQVAAATFTVTNSGAYGSLFFTPIINQPQVGILGMGKVTDTPVVRGGQVVVRKMMYLCLSYDHRAVDGAPAVQFLQCLRHHIEQP